MPELQTIPIYGKKLIEWKKLTPLSWDEEKMTTDYYLVKMRPSPFLDINANNCVAQAPARIVQKEIYQRQMGLPATNKFAR